MLLILQTAVTAPAASARGFSFDPATWLAMYSIFAVITFGLWKALTPFRHKLQVDDAKTNSAAWRQALTEGPSALLSPEVTALREMQHAMETDRLSLRVLQRAVEAQGMAMDVLPDINRALDRNNIVLEGLAREFAAVKQNGESTRVIVGDIVAVMRARGQWEGGGHRYDDK